MEWFASHSGGEPLLTAKIQCPPLCPGVIMRQRLMARLSQGQEQLLSLVIAPAGYVKTTLLSTWARQLPRPGAWVSLEADDSLPQRFWAYVIAALDAAQPGVGAAAQLLLGDADSTLDQILAALLNALAAAQPMTLILDNYHLIQSSCIDESLVFLLEHLLQSLHVVLASRSEPLMPLAHWRAADALTELGMRDLGFTYAEATGLFAQSMPVPVAEDTVRLLVSRTEGWAAALRLAARAARTSSDPDAALWNFHGSNRDLQDYLAQEVLGTLPGDVQTFLLHTSLLDRLCALSCASCVDLPGDLLASECNHADALANSQAASQERILAAQAMLAHIDRAGLFVVPLDAERAEYRYHALFAEALRYRLNCTPDLPALPALLQAPRDWPSDAAVPGAALSAREMDVLRLLAEGNTNQEIARILIIGVNTVKMHVQHLYDKLDVHNRVQAIQRAHAAGVL